MDKNQYNINPYIYDHLEEISKAICKKSIFTQKDIELMVSFANSVDKVLLAIKIESETGNSAWEFLEFLKEKHENEIQYK